MSYIRRAIDNRPAIRDNYAEVTNQIVAALEAGNVPWRRPWDHAKACNGSMAPRNAITGRRYRGINVLLLGMTGLGFSSYDPRWLTYKQAEAKGWQVRRGERGSRVFFFRKLTVQDRDAPADGSATTPDQTRSIPLLRAYTVFNASQVEGAPPFIGASDEEVAWQTPDAVEIIMRESRAIFVEGGERAFYCPATDHIQLPPRHAFVDSLSFAEVALHELSHWTSHPTRLDRELNLNSKSNGYAFEELRAELASCFMAAELGLPGDLQNHASYIASWAAGLREDKRAIFRAAADAQRIADYLLGFHPEHARRITEEAGGDAAQETGD